MYITSQIAQVFGANIGIMLPMPCRVALLFVTTFLFLSVTQIDSFSLERATKICNRGNRVTTMMVAYPTKIRNVITKMTESTQTALQKMISRMEIELPPGADFGVESSAKQSSKTKIATESDASKVKKSNREAARLVAEMFSVLSSTSIAIFPSEAEASDARMKWGSTFKGQVYSIDAPPGSKGSGNLYSKKMSAQEQEQALLGSDGVYIPEGTQLIIVAGPRAKDIKKLKKIHDRLGEETLIIFINARASIAAASASGKKTADPDLDTENADWVSGAFTSVFHYAPPLLGATEPASQIENKKRELLLYHEFGGDWHLAEKEAADGIFGTGFTLPSISSGFKTLWEGSTRPDKKQLLEALKAIRK